MNMDVSVILFYNVNRGWLDKAKRSYERDAAVFNGRMELIEIHADRTTAENLNDGLRQCSGRYVRLLGEDDMLVPGGTQALFNHIDRGYDVVVARAQNYHMDSNEFQEYQSTIPGSVAHLADINTIHGGTVMYRRSALEAVGGWDETLLYAEEFDLHLRMAAAGYSFGVISDLVFIYRIHAHQKSMQGGYRDDDAYLQRKRWILHNVVDRFTGNHARIQTQPHTVP